MKAHLIIVRTGRRSARRMVMAALVLLAVAIIAPAAAAEPIVAPGFTIERISTANFPLVQPTGLVVDRDGNIYVGRNFYSGQSDLLRIAPSGSVSSMVSLGNHIGGLALNSTGQLFGSLHPETIFRFQDGAANTFATLPHLSVPERLAFDRQDSLFVALFGGPAVSRVSADGVVTPFVENLEGPFAVAFRGDSLFIGDNLNRGNGPGRLLEADPTGAIKDVFGPVGDRIVDQEYDPHSDSFLIANQGEVAILRFQNSTITTFAAGFADHPRDMAFDSHGNLYIADATSLYRISPVSPVPIPEPSTIGLLGLGLLVLPVSGWRARNQKQPGAEPVFAKPLKRTPTFWSAPDTGRCTINL